MERCPAGSGCAVRHPALEAKKSKSVRCVLWSVRRLPPTLPRLVRAVVASCDEGTRPATSPTSSTSSRAAGQDAEQRLVVTPQGSRRAGSQARAPASDDRHPAQPGPVPIQVISQHMYPDCRRHGVGRALDRRRCRLSLRAPAPATVATSRPSGSRDGQTASWPGLALGPVAPCPRLAPTTVVPVRPIAQRRPVQQVPARQAGAHAHHPAPLDAGARYGRPLAHHQLAPAQSPEPAHAARNRARPRRDPRRASHQRRRPSPTVRARGQASRDQSQSRLRSAGLGRRRPDGRLRPSPCGRSARRRTTPRARRRQSTSTWPGGTSPRRAPRRRRRRRSRRSLLARSPRTRRSPNGEAAAGPAQPAPGRQRQDRGAVTSAPADAADQACGGRVPVRGPGRRHGRAAEQLGKAKSKCVAASTRARQAGRRGPGDRHDQSERGDRV